MPRIFISYRRNDSASNAGRIFDRLEGHFGEGQVFMDVDTIKPGVNFVEAVEQAVGVCDGLVAVIGREWLGASDDSGRRRLENPEDLVRLEIATALSRNIRVIPVLVQGARMPVATDLPEGLEVLARRNSVEVSDNRFRSDIEQLIGALEAPTSETLADTVYVEPAQIEGSTFVGREREMGELNKALEEALTGQGRLVMLVGEPGIGKTRTAQQLASYAETLGAQVWWGRCYEAEGAPSYWPWVQPIRSYVQQSDPQQLTSEMGPGAADVAELVPEIHGKLPDLEPPPVLEPEQTRFRLFDSVTGFLKNAARSQCLMLVLDDLQWADRSSLRLLEFLAREMAASPILVIGTYRDVELSRQHPLSETLAQLSREPVFQRVLLRGLSPEDAAPFIEAVSSVQPHPSLAKIIYAHTEGNPYFMTEVVHLLSEQDALTAPAGETAGHLDIRIPEGVREVIGQRLNRLSEDCNRMLSTASIIGREFDFELLRALNSEVSYDRLLEALEEASAARLIEELPQGVGQYQFAHALIQETLSAELSTLRRVRLHARIAETLEDLYGANAEAHAAELAYHFAEAATATDTDKLVHYLLVAGEQALASYAWEEALDHFQQGLDTKEGLPMDGDTAALLFGLGRAQAATVERRRLGEVVTNLSRAFDYYAGAGDVAHAVAVAENPVLHLPGQIEGRMRLVDQALDLVLADSHEAGHLLSLYCSDLGIDAGDYDGAQEAFRRALAIAGHEQDESLEMQALARAAAVDGYHLRFPESLEKNLRAIKLAQKLDDPVYEISSRFFAALALWSTGDLATARTHAGAGLALAEKLRDRFWLASMLWANEIICRLEGDFQTAVAFNERGLALLPRDPRLLGTRSLMEFEIGEFEQGRAHLDRLLETMHDTPQGPAFEYAFVATIVPSIARISGLTEWLDDAEMAADIVLSSPSVTPLVAVRARAGMAWMAVVRGDSVAAPERYAALESRRGTMTPGGMWSIDHILGLLLVTQGNLKEAMVHFEEALALCAAAGYRPERAYAACDYADTLLQRNQPGDREKAISLLDESLAISSELGMRPLMERVISRQDGLQV